MFNISKRINSSAFIQTKCSVRKFFEKSGGLRNPYLLVAVVVPPGIACLFGGIYLWYNRSGLDEKGPHRLRIRDPEFTGATLVKTRAPYFSNNDTTEWCLFDYMIKGADDARNELSGKLHPNDVFVCSYPKSGTTWLSEVVYLLVTKLNWKEALASNLEERVPYLEHVWPGVKAIAEGAAPRIIKTHLPFCFLPEEVQDGRAARVIYIVRDPRDVVVSFYHFVRCFVPAGYRNKEKFNGFVRRFIEDRLPYSPWDEHVKSYLRPAASWRTGNAYNTKESYKPKVLFVRYETLKANPILVIRQIESFLLDTWTNGDGPNEMPDRLTDVQMATLAEHCSFPKMSKNPMTNYTWLEEHGLWCCEDDNKFMRRGIVGDHKSLFSTEESESLVLKAKLAGLDWTLQVES